MAKLYTPPHKKWTFFIIFFPTVLVLSAIFITFTSPSLSPFGQKEIGVSIKNVYTSIPSSDGESHSFAADFYITSSKKHVSQTETTTVQGAILKIIPTLDYDKITQKNGTHYLIESLNKELKSDPSNQWINEVYVSSLLLDVGISDVKDEQGTSIEEMFRNY